MALFGIYGSHTTESCPLNNVVVAQGVVEFGSSDFDSIAKKYKINKFVGQYHSALEHTFLWIVDAEDPHEIQRFCVETKVASFNAVKIVPLTEFKDVVEKLKKIHSL